VKRVGYEMLICMRVSCLRADEFDDTFKLSYDWIGTRSS
jgi:hypothetical protein